MKIKKGTNPDNQGLFPNMKRGKAMLLSLAELYIQTFTSISSNLFAFVYSERSEYTKANRFEDIEVKVYI